MSKLSWWKTTSLLCVLCVVEAIGSPAETFKTLANFDGTNGDDPEGLVQGTDGNFYGTTAGGGTGSGTIFKITPGGVLTTLHSFNTSDGSSPLALVQGTDGNFYGTTYVGGDLSCYDGGGYGCGTVFKVTASGKLTTLHSFDGTDGSQPAASLVQATDGNFYGTTINGGACILGTVFKITPSGELTTLYNFCGSSDGWGPGPLVQATDGNFYGTMYFGGASGLGTVFKITATGKLTTLHSFDGTDGSNPRGALVQATGRELLWDHLLRRGRQPRHSIRNDAGRQADHADQLQQQ
jgi:uncharacterized repeat protein (TIGR03803 family)